MLGIVVHINNTVLALVWVYTDLFLIVVSICIRTRFEQLFERIKGADKTASPKFWKDIRMHYIYILDILEVANTNLPAIVFVSCFSNFYFICYQLITLTNECVYRAFRVGWSILLTPCDFSAMSHFW
jgi:Trehalose receptor